MPNALQRHGWTRWHAVLALTLVALGVLSTLSAWDDILRIARRDEESSHIFLVPLVAGWMVWVRRGRFRLCQPKGMWIGPVLVLVGWIMSAWGFRQSVQSFWHGGAVLVAVGCLLSVMGRGVLIRFLPAFAVLIFLVPIPGRVRQRVAIPLQTATAQVTQSLFELGGVPVERMGNVLIVNDEPIEIAEACNGMRMVFALVLVSFAFAFGEPLRNYVRFLIVGASPLSAIFCNVLRMLPTVWLFGNGRYVAPFLGMRPGPGETEKQVGLRLANGFHDISGWIMLGVAFLLLMGIVRILRWALIPVAPYTLASE